MKFSIFFSFHSLLLSVITVSMDPVAENDNIYAPCLHLSPETPNSEALGACLGSVHVLHEFLISLTSFKALARGSIPPLLILNFLEVSK